MDFIERTYYLKSRFFLILLSGIILHPPLLRIFRWIFLRPHLRGGTKYCIGIFLFLVAVLSLRHKRVRSEIIFWQKIMEKLFHIGLGLRNKIRYASPYSEKSRTRLSCGFLTTPTSWRTTSGSRTTHRQRSGSYCKIMVLQQLMVVQ